MRPSEDGADPTGDGDSGGARDRALPGPSTGTYEDVCELLRSEVPARPGHEGKVPRTNFTRVYRASGNGYEKVGPRGLFFYMDRLVRRYAWAIPSASALKSIERYAPLVEIGAGSGYWASLLAERGVDIVCFDRHRPGEAGSSYRTMFHPIQRGGPRSLDRVGRERNLFLCWPPHEEPMAARCLQHFRGRRAVYLGEGEDGRNANATFFEILEREWLLIDSFDIPQWEEMEDRGWVYERRSESGTNDR